MREPGRDRLHQLQNASLAGQRTGIHRHDDVHDQAAFRDLFDPAVGLLLPDLPQHVAVGQHRQQVFAFAADVSHDTTALVEQGQFLDRALLAQGGQAGDDRTHAFVRQGQRHALSLVVEIAQQVVQRGLPEVDTGGERIVHPHVKPGFDRAIEKEHRCTVHHQARQHGDDAEHQQQFQRELGAKDAATDALLQPPHAPAQQDQQGHAQDGAADEKRRQRVGKGAAAAAGIKQQRQKHNTQEQGDDDQTAHQGKAAGGTGTMGVSNDQPYQGVASSQRSPPTAPMVSGLGSCEVSSRRRRRAS